MLSIQSASHLESLDVVEKVRETTESDCVVAAAVCPSHDAFPLWSGRPAANTWDHDQMVVLRSDLDPADVGEVSRRVARPVASELLYPDEFARCRVEVVLRPGLSRLTPGAFEPHVTCRMDVDGESGEFFLCMLDFARADRNDLADKLSEHLKDWLAESSLSWGELRAPHPGLPVGKAKWPSGVAGQPMLEVYPDEESEGLLWRQAEQVPADALDLSEGLRLALTEWRTRWITALEGPTPLPVVDLERGRTAVVRQLQIELQGTHEVAVPISLDPTGWPAYLDSGEEASGRTIQIGQPVSWLPERSE